MVKQGAGRWPAEPCECASRAAASSAAEGLELSEVGSEGTLEHRVHLETKQGRPLSFWHSVPLHAGNGLLNYVCEIPRKTRAKFEVATAEANNPIKQDSKKGKPRFYALDIEWNYGMLPQTWEDPEHASPECGGHVGDNDPVDVVEVGNRTATTGEICAVKPIAAFAMIDEGELDWKVVAIAATDPRVNLVHDVEDMEVHFPGTLSAIREWFRTYKTLDGKPENKFELGERAMDRAFTLDVIAETHGFWKALVQKAWACDLAGEEAVSLTVGNVPIPTACFEPSSDVTSISSDDNETDPHLVSSASQGSLVLGSDDAQDFAVVDFGATSHLEVDARERAPPGGGLPKSASYITSLRKLPSMVRRLGQSFGMKSTAACSLPVHDNSDAHGHKRSLMERSPSSASLGGVQDSKRAEHEHPAEEGNTVQIVVQA
eukprot:SM000032S12130  [mRNA]  locus=s32:667587:669674:- [translate_table: standard]